MVVKGSLNKTQGPPVAPNPLATHAYIPLCIVLLLLVSVICKVISVAVMVPAL
jgi:hypothetical protein